MRTMRALSTCGLIAVVATIATFAAPVVVADVPADVQDGTTVAVAHTDHADHSDEAHATTATEIAGMTATAPSAQILGWDTPTARRYYLTSSCSGWASTIRRGAAAWNRLSEGGGTPVECRNSYITDCGGGSRVVGCNWGRGQRIALFMGGVGDGALLAAHEFGHDWYGHSSYRCAGWSSPAHVMAPSICTFSGAGTLSKAAIDR